MIYEEKPAHGKKGITVKVFNNNIEGAISQLKRKVNLEGITKELRKRRYFEPNTARRRREMSEAVMRWNKKKDQIFETVREKRKTKKKVDKKVAKKATSD